MMITRGLWVASVLLAAAAAAADAVDVSNSRQDVEVSRGKRSLGFYIEPDEKCIVTVGPDKTAKYKLVVDLASQNASDQLIMQVVAEMQSMKTASQYNQRQMLQELAEILNMTKKHQLQVDQEKQEASQDNQRQIQQLATEMQNMKAAMEQQANQTQQVLREIQSMRTAIEQHREDERLRTQQFTAAALDEIQSLNNATNSDLQLTVRVAYKIHQLKKMEQFKYVGENTKMQVQELWDALPSGVRIIVSGQVVCIREPDDGTDGKQYLYTELMNWDVRISSINYASKWKFEAFEDNGEVLFRIKWVPGPDGGGTGNYLYVGLDRDEFSRWVFRGTYAGPESHWQLHNATSDWPPTSFYLYNTHHVEYLGHPTNDSSSTTCINYQQCHRLSWIIDQNCKD